MNPTTAEQSQPVSSVSTGEFLRSLALALIALALSAVMIIVAFLALTPVLADHNSNATRDNVRTWEIRGADLVPRMGNGTKTERSGLRVLALESGIDNRAIFTRRVGIKAADYPFIEYAIADAHPALNVYFIWRTAADPDTVHNVLLPLGPKGSGVIHLAGRDRWTGTISEAGLDIYGELRDDPVEVMSLTMRPSSPRLLLQAIGSEWTAFRGWTQRSAHHLRGTLGNPMVSPALAAAAWAIVAVLLLLCVFRLTGRSDISAIIAAVALAWISLDMLWQSNLARQLDETRHLFEDKSTHEKRLADWDADLYQYALHLKNTVLPEPGQRIVLLHNSEDRTYRRLRAQYFLLPHNIYNYGKLPTHSGMRVGDLVLVLGQHPGLSFDPDTSELTWENRSAQVERLDSHPAGTLYRWLGRSVPE